MKIESHELFNRICYTLKIKGLNEECSRATAECMVLADLYGIITHGSVVLPSHIKRIEIGGYNLNPKFDVISENNSFAVIDANNSIGFASACHCMRYAMKRAQEKGMCSVFSRNAKA